MRIAQVAPLYESVPPLFYGGTERVISYLTEELVRMGHDVTLYASRDSKTAAKLLPMTERALWRRRSECKDQLAPHITMLERVFADIEKGLYDIVHFHTDYLHFPLARRVPKQRHLTTVHGRLDLSDVSAAYKAYPEMPLVSISDAQRSPLPDLNWQATVYHGLPADLYHPVSDNEGKYLAFLGRLSREKRPDRAVAIAKKFGMKIKIAAKVDPVDQEYFDHEVAPILDDPLVEFVGEINDEQKNEFLGNAFAFLFPIDWPEPFGMVLIESLACGTPVVAFANGSVNEVIEDGLNGFVVGSVDEAVTALNHVRTLSRSACRETFLARFSVGQMAAGYLASYEGLLREESPPLSEVIFLHGSSRRSKIV